FDGRSLSLYHLAGEYTLAYQSFHAAFGDGFLDDFWLMCACTPRYDNAPVSLVAQLDQQGLVPTSIATDRYRAYDAGPPRPWPFQHPPSGLNNRAESSPVPIYDESARCKAF